MLFYILFVVLFIAALLFVSSRIRRAANAAFVPEIVENDEFRISKPEGFLNPIPEASKHPFEAYSREVGERAAGRIRKSTAELNIADGLQMKQIIARIKRENAEVYSQEILTTAPAGQKICQLEAQKVVDEISFLVFHKIVENRQRNKTYDLRVEILKANEEEYLPKASVLINSFTVK